jgi:predicted DNA-binding transcriptional regulator YafY
MRKAERLFQIIQILRRSGRPVTSAQLAAELEVGRRTVYRDIAELIGQRVPIEGEAGLGYVLASGYDMPPLMLTADEIEAVALGMEMVARLNDSTLRNAARDVIAKITHATPDALLPFIAHPAVALKPDDRAVGSMDLDTRPLRSAIRSERKLRLDYRAASGELSNRTVWPILLGYGDTRCLLIAWCEKQQAFRHFRTERIMRVEVLPERIGVGKQKLHKQWQDWREGERRRFASLS